MVIITTKKGADGALTVGVASKVSTSSANKLPEVQTVFGPGSLSANGVLNTASYNSWGPKIPADSTKYDNIGNFFRHSIVYDNNVNVSGGNKNGSFFCPVPTTNRMVSFRKRIMRRRHSDLTASSVMAV
ncbi:hypothetical protein ACQ86N_26665 [Puia sp. P3]|uniref:hypothetical protein n=1 Tax=Puia sp. P3 TaxID=3423952 RepID=UPI003D678401